jgi:glycosyltransferase involved in cell wall biosynthesis
MSAVRRVVAVSADIRDALEKIPRLKGKVSYIPNGVPLPDAAGASRRGARPWTVAIVGRLSIEKGHGIFLDAARRVLLKKPDVSFWVIGDGPLRETLEEQAGRLGVGSRVRFLGFRSDMDKLYPKIDLAASASLREGLPMALLEAMAHGKPVVATRVGDVPHIVRNGVNGYVVPPGDSEALENAMLRILAHPSRIRRFGKASRFIVESGYSSESMAASYLSLYREILGEGTA